MLDELISAYGNRFLVAALGVALALLCLFIVLWLMRNRAPSPFVRGGRNRQPRLQVLDAAAVDARRRIVLIRRDNVEHLVMIGGPTDIVIESGIGDERAYLSALAVQPRSEGEPAVLPQAETARLGPAAAEPAPLQPVVTNRETPVASEVATAPSAPTRAKAPQPPQAAATAEPQRQTAQHIAPAAVQSPAPASAPAPSVQPIIITAAAASAVVAAPPQPIAPVLGNEPKVIDLPLPVEASRAAEVRPEPRPETPSSSAPAAEPSREPSAPQSDPLDVLGTTAPIRNDVAFSSPAPDIMHEPRSQTGQEPVVRIAPEPDPEGVAPVSPPPAAQFSTAQVSTAQAPRLDIAPEPAVSRVPDVTAPDAANILETARARVMPQAQSAQAAPQQPFAAERFIARQEPRQEPSLAKTEVPEPPRDMSEFERVLEEEMALHLAADPLPMPTNDSPAFEPLLPEIRSNRPGLPLSAILPESRHVAPQSAKPSSAPAQNGEEPNLQSEIARIFGEMSASRGS